MAWIRRTHEPQSVPALQAEAIWRGVQAPSVRVLLDLLLGDAEATADVHAVHLPPGSIAGAVPMIGEANLTLPVGGTAKVEWGADRM